MSKAHVGQPWSLEHCLVHGFDEQAPVRPLWLVGSGGVGGTEPCQNDVAADPVSATPRHASSLRGRVIEERVAASLRTPTRRTPKPPPPLSSFHRPCTEMMGAPFIRQPVASLARAASFGGRGVLEEWSGGRLPVPSYFFAACSAAPPLRVRLSRAGAAKFGIRQAAKPQSPPARSPAPAPLQVEAGAGCTRTHRSGGALSGPRGSCKLVARGFRGVAWRSLAARHGALALPCRPAPRCHLLRDSRQASHSLKCQRGRAPEDATFLSPPPPPFPLASCSPMNAAPRRA